MDRKCVTDGHDGDVFSAIKQNDGTEDHRVKRNKPSQEGSASWFFSGIGLGE